MFTSKNAPNSTAIYNQTLPAGGYGYLTTRDGTKLAINVHLPGPAEDGPYPTLVEYSGYGYAEPGRRRRAAIARSPTCSATRSST